MMIHSTVPTVAHGSAAIVSFTARRRMISSGACWIGYGCRVRRPPWPLPATRAYFDRMDRKVLCFYCGWRMFLSENRDPPSPSQGHAFPEHALELDLRRLPDRLPFRAEVEELLLGEAEHAREQRCREAL